MLVCLKNDVFELKCSTRSSSLLSTVPPVALSHPLRLHLVQHGVPVELVALACKQLLLQLSNAIRCDYQEIAGTFR